MLGEFVLPTSSPGTGERATQSQLYSINELDEYADFLEEIQQAAAEQVLPLDTALKECAPGQFEINLIHCNDALRAGDSAVLLKREFKRAAAWHFCRCARHRCRTDRAPTRALPI